jgi:transcriptional regulator with XRE-family HTH domain
MSWTKQPTIVFGDRILKLRKAAGLSRKVMGDKAKIATASLFNWETGATCPEAHHVKRLEEFFGQPAGSLLALLPEGPFVRITKGEKTMQVAKAIAAAKEIPIKEYRAEMISISSDMVEMFVEQQWKAMTLQQKMELITKKGI